MKYIIDGYNLIHKIPQLAGKRLRSQREGLLRLLEGTSAQNPQLKNLTVVFDGRAEIISGHIRSSVKTIFSKNESADKKIKQIVESSSFARDTAVVSDDREIRFYIGSLGAKKVSVREFLKKISRRRQRQQTFELDMQQVNKINRELEQIWLK